MNKVKHRAMSALIVAALIIVGLGVYIVRYLENGAKWATFAVGGYTSGVVSMGTITDRNGVVLANADGSSRTYADDWSVRRACYHAVGDYTGNVGSGALSAFAAQLAGYNPITGTYARGGREVKLSIDSRLCVVAQEALAGRKGAVLLSNYRTGEILCMTSNPTTDPADSTAEIADGTYLNRCISVSYTPGSVFKLITSAAAIENLPDLAQQTFTCWGSMDVAGVTINCTGSHGEQTFEEALANSCNVAFANITLQLGGDTLERYVYDYGFTRTHKLDSIITAGGSFTKDNPGTPGLAWSGIGQFEDAICPYSMLRYVSAIASNGILQEPTLLAGKNNGSANLMQSTTANKLRDMMSYNVQAHYGAWNFPGLNLCAKTGTAEVGDGTSHAWFTGFLLDEAHPYAFVVIVENAGAGITAAAPVANTVLQAAVNG